MKPAVLPQHAVRDGRDVRDVHGVPAATAITAEPRAPMDEAGAVAALAALAQPMRLRVFRSLVGAGPAGLTPGVLAATLGLPPSSLSFHLKELVAARLVSAERVGRHIVYRPAIGSMNELLAYLTQHCCHGEPCELLTPDTDCSSSPPGVLNALNPSCARC